MHVMQRNRKKLHVIQRKLRIDARHTKNFKVERHTTKSKRDALHTENLKKDARHTRKSKDARLTNKLKNDARYVRNWRDAHHMKKLKRDARHTRNFSKRATNYRALLRYMTWKDKASYASTPPCSRKLLRERRRPYRKNREMRVIQIRELLHL